MLTCKCKKNLQGNVYAAKSDHDDQTNMIINLTNTKMWSELLQPLIALVQILLLSRDRISTTLITDLRMRLEPMTVTVIVSIWD